MEITYGHHARNDRWIAESVFPGRRGGFFVEAGACGGLSGSASFVLERELGWEGICVEPQPDYYRILTARRQCRTDDRCLAEVSGDERDFLTFADAPARGGIAASNSNRAWAARHGADGTLLSVVTVTLADLLDQHDAPEVIHYLCLDLEGGESAVLGSFDFASRTILAMSVEGRKCDGLLEAVGYRQVNNPFAPERIDHYFLHPDYQAPTSPRA